MLTQHLSWSLYEVTTHLCWYSTPDGGLWVLVLGTGDEGCVRCGGWPMGSVVSLLPLRAGGSRGRSRPPAGQWGESLILFTSWSGIWFMHWWDQTTIHVPSLDPRPSTVVQDLNYIEQIWQIDIHAHVCACAHVTNMVRSRCYLNLTHQIAY